MPETSGTIDNPAPTRRSLHAIAEMLISGPQYRAHGTIRLKPTAAGFAGVALPVGIEGAELVWEGGRAPVDGRTCAELGGLAGIDAGQPEDLYADHSGVVPDESLVVDTETAVRLLAWYRLGDAALRAFAPDQTPVLWPEHFDLGIVVGEVNYGVSMGDGFVDQPYAYVVPFEARTGEFWNVPFGAARTIDQLPSDTAITEFFAEGREQIG
ncbi:hypothetical protein [Aldersonia kunmingensis]|uniref:hypothetical protein n=1 Tax=Aldersonia kunmingensis TaxID=408066 RepID=UPI000836C44E|nr:hypothetical protein [Aldersonia kunmingensis]